MPRGPNFDANETAALATAWLKATDDPEVGTDQDSTSFQIKVHQELEKLSPANAPLGKHHHRSLHLIFGNLCDKIFKEIQKFNQKCKLVLASEPSGTTDDKNINMAVASHQEKTNKMDHNFKNCNAKNNWKYLEAWKILKHCPKFSISNSSSIDSANETESSFSSATSIQASRGGPGKTTTKRQTAYKKALSEREAKKQARHAETTAKLSDLIETSKTSLQEKKKTHKIQAITQAHNMRSGDSEKQEELKEKLMGIVNED